MRSFLIIFQKVLVVGGLGAALFIFLFVFVFNGEMDKMIGLKNKLLGRKNDTSDDSKSKKKENKKNNKKEANSKDNNKKSNKKTKINIVDTQDFLDFEEIKIFSPSQPIGLIVKKKKKDYVGVIEVKGINYNLLSIEERETLEENFGKLLNGINYPIQIFVQSRKIEIENYAKQYDKRLEEIKKSLDKMNEKLNFLKESNEPEEVIKKTEITINRIMAQLTYGIQIRDYLIGKCKEKTMLERKYYIVLSHKHNKLSFKEELTEEELLHNAFFDISTKSNSIIAALQKSNLYGKLLTGFELADLLYRSYNKSDSEYYKLERALKSGFSHLYTTAKPVELKRLERQSKEIDQELAEISKAKVG